MAGFLFLICSLRDGYGEEAVSGLDQWVQPFEWEVLNSIHGRNKVAPDVCLKTLRTSVVGRTRVWIVVLINNMGESLNLDLWLLHGNNQCD